MFNCAGILSGSLTIIIIGHLADVYKVREEPDKLGMMMVVGNAGLMVLSGPLFYVSGRYYKDEVLTAREYGQIEMK